MTWTYDICDTVHGQKLSQVEPISGSFSRVLNGIGSGTHAFVATSLGTSPNASGNYSRRVLTAPWSRTLVQSWDGVPRYAGVITSQDWDEDADRITITHSEIREIFKRRRTFGVDGYKGEVGGTLTVEKNTIESLVGWLIWQGMQGLAPNWSLPIIPPPRNVAGPHTRIWHDYNMPVVEAEMTALQNAYGGPDIDFQQQWTLDPTEPRLVWQSRVGELTGRLLEWYPGAAERPKITKLKVTEDGSKTGNMIYAVGNGQERDKLVRKALADTDQPALERVEMYGNLTDKGWLQGHADADLATFRLPTEQVSFSIRAGDKDAGVNDLVLGQPLRLNFKNHGWFDDGPRDYRLIGYSGDLTENIALQVQPRQGT